MARDKMLWVFNAGGRYDGNPKWLFEYMRRHRPDIACYWLCGGRRLFLRLRAAGIPALLFGSKAARNIGSRAGVYVVCQNKEVIHDYLRGAVILNLWHGVGCKAIENKLSSGILNRGIAKKHIQNNLYYARDTLFLVTSPLMEQHFCAQCDLGERQIVRAGYPSVEFDEPESVRTFDHDAACGSNELRLALYAPTYRDYAGGSLCAALPNMDELVRVLSDARLRLIVKVHPQMTNDPQFRQLQAAYGSSEHLVFWNNDHDIYEILDRIDLAIVDYSSMFYDLVKRGVTHFIRYTYDFEREDQSRPFALDYHTHTCGRECKTFDELLDAIRTFEERDDSIELKRLRELFWSYANDGNTFNTIVRAALAFEPDPSFELPTLYSFDIFDTLIARSTHVPQGIFPYVAHKMSQSSLGFSSYLINNYAQIRMWCEENVRTRRIKTPKLSDEGRTEITFSEIFGLMAHTYNLTNKQTEQLMAWELEAEYRSSVPLTEGVQKVRQLVQDGQDVVLISDMYLPKEFVYKLLAKADPALATLPLFLSSDRGGQKTRETLFLDVYHTLDYHYGSWVHYGDSPKADYAVPKSLGIQPVLVGGATPLLDFEQELVDHVGTYDAYLATGLLASFRQRKGIKSALDMDYFTYGICSLYFVPYLSWVVRDACDQGIQTLYFISRDGYLLKLVADEIIRATGADLRTEYIYGSRKAWRLPSQIDEIDDDFFMHYGNFSATLTYDRVVQKSFMDEASFARLFPSLEAYKGLNRNFTRAELDAVRQTLSQSSEYKEYLLKRAAEERPIVEEYLTQAIDTSCKHAFVEYWGRGYTQTCLSRLLRHATKKDEPCTFYYARSMYESEGFDVRRCFSSNSASLVFVESLFANNPHKSVTGYRKQQDGTVLPIFEANSYDAELFLSLCTNLVLFARDYMQLNVLDRDRLDRSLFDWALYHFYRNEESPLYIKHLSQLQDAFQLNGEVSSFAPPLTVGSFVTRLKEGRWPETKSIRMSVAQANPMVRAVYTKLKDIREEDDYTSDTKGSLHKALANKVKHG